MEKPDADPENTPPEPIVELTPEPALTRRSPPLTILGRKVPMPRTRLGRILLGSFLILFGVLGFLPVLGFWMVPLGLLVLAYDFAAVRRFNRRSGVWIRRQIQKW